MTDWRQSGDWQGVEIEDPPPGKGGFTNGEAKGGLLHPRSMASLAGEPVPVLKFMMPQWVPHGYPVLLCGRGSIGKTTLACQFGATLAIGDWFLGMQLPQLKSS